MTYIGRNGCLPFKENQFCKNALEIGKSFVEVTFLKELLETNTTRYKYE